MELFELQEVLLGSSLCSASLAAGSPAEQYQILGAALQYQILDAALTVAVWRLRTGAATMGSETLPDSTWQLPLIMKGVLMNDSQQSSVSRGLELD